MQQQEGELISGLFDRLQPFESQPRDPQAEGLIKDRVARQAGSPYLLVQTVLVQEQALKAAQERIADLEAKAGANQAPASFLGSAPKIGPWGAASEQQPRPAAVPANVPSSRSPLQAALSPQPMGMGGGGGGFLRSALTTAAGVAGGALLFEGIRNLMGGSPGVFGPALAQTPSALLPPDSLPSDTSSSDMSSNDSLAQQSAFDDSNTVPQDDQSNDYDTASADQDQDFGGSDFGGGSDDDSWT